MIRITLYIWHLQLHMAFNITSTYTHKPIYLQGTYQTTQKINIPEGSTIGVNMKKQIKGNQDVNTNDYVSLPFEFSS